MPRTSTMENGPQHKGNFLLRWGGTDRDTALSRHVGWDVRVHDCN